MLPRLVPPPQQLIPHDRYRGAMSAPPMTDGYVGVQISTPGGMQAPYSALPVLAERTGTRGSDGKKEKGKKKMACAVM